MRRVTFGVVVPCPRRKGGQHLVWGDFQHRHEVGVDDVPYRDIDRH